MSFDHPLPIPQGRIGTDPAVHADRARFLLGGAPDTRPAVGAYVYDEALGRERWYDEAELGELQSKLDVDADRRTRLAHAMAVAEYRALGADLKLRLPGLRAAAVAAWEAVQALGAIGDAPEPEPGARSVSGEWVRVTVVRRQVRARWIEAVYAVEAAEAHVALYRRQVDLSRRLAGGGLLAGLRS